MSYIKAIIAQGRAEGVVHVRSPDDSARVLVSLIHGAQDLAGELFFAREAGAVTFGTSRAGWPLTRRRMSGFWARSPVR